MDACNQAVEGVWKLMSDHWSESPAVAIVTYYLALLYGYSGMEPQPNRYSTSLMKETLYYILSLMADELKSGHTGRFILVCFILLLTNHVAGGSIVGEHKQSQDFRSEPCRLASVEIHIKMPFWKLHPLMRKTEFLETRNKAQLFICSVCK